MHVSAYHGQAKCKCCTIPYASVWKITPGVAVDWVYDSNSNTQSIAVDSSGNVYVAGIYSATLGGNFFKLNSSGVLQWAIQLGSSPTYTNGVIEVPDGSGDMIVGSSLATYNLYRVTPSGSVVWQITGTDGVGNILEFTRFATDGTSLYAAHGNAAGIGGRPGACLYDFSGTQLDILNLGTNAFASAAMDLYTADSVLFGRAAPDKGIMTATASTMSAVAFFQTAHAFMDLDSSDGTNVFAAGSQGTRKMTDATFAYAWTVASKGTDAVAADGTGKVYSGGSTVSSKTVWRFSGSGSEEWSYYSGARVFDLAYAGSTIYVVGLRNNTYATTA